MVRMRGDGLRLTFWNFFQGVNRCVSFMGTRVRPSQGKPMDRSRAWKKFQALGVQLGVVVGRTGAFHDRLDVERRAPAGPRGVPGGGMPGVPKSGAGRKD